MAERAMISRLAQSSWQRLMTRRLLCLRALLALVCLTSGLVYWNWQRVAAARAATGLTTLDLATLPSQTAATATEPTGVRVATYEGMFDPATNEMSIRQVAEETAAERTGNGRTINGRSNPTGEIPRSLGFNFNVTNSTYLSTGDQAGHISGEIRLSNQTGVTLYNTRLLFTKLRTCAAAPAACDGVNNTGTVQPGANGFVYYNDGLLPYQGGLSVSRAYGDINPNGGSSSRVWTFNVSTAPTRFFFAFVVLADWGVAAESVYPAAVQVSGATGNTVTIRGRGFTSTPTVALLDGTGNQVTALTNVTRDSDTQVTATVPAGTAAGIYGIRVTLPGGTPDGQNSSVIAGRLTVTAVPSETLSGTITSLSGTGPFIVTSDLTINSALTILPGTVFYVNSNARILLGPNAVFNANGGVPGVPTGAGIALPAQIVFTAQRSPGAGLPVVGAWGGFETTGAATGLAAGGDGTVMRNVVVEFGGGGANLANLNMRNSGRALRFTDSISRLSARSGIDAGSATDRLVGFTRNRIDYNGQAAGTPALLISANAALGLYELPSNTPLVTAVPDGQYFYSAANDFTGNQLDVIQVGQDNDNTSNDFTGSGVLVGQEPAPIHLRGTSSNPAIVGGSPTPAELTIGPTARILLAQGLDLQAGDYANNRAGCIAANGFAGINLAATSPSVNSRFIVFDRIGTANFGSLFFSQGALPNCQLNFVIVNNGGAGARGGAAVIAEITNISIKNTQVNGSSSGSLIEVGGSIMAASGITGTGNQLVIDTVVGGLFGNGNPGSLTTLWEPRLVTADPLNRGVFIVDRTEKGYLLRFFNTTRNDVMVAGLRVAAGTMRLIAGGGPDFSSDNVAGLDIDMGDVTGLAAGLVGPAGQDGIAVFFIDAIAPSIRYVNVAETAITVAGRTTMPGKINTLSTSVGLKPVGLAVRPTTRELFFSDNTGNRVFKVATTTGSGTSELVAGAGGASAATDPFSGVAPTQLKLLQPKGIAFEGDNIFLADSGHHRVINIGTNPARLMVQFPQSRLTGANPIYKNPPSPESLAVLNGQLYVMNQRAQNIVRLATNTLSPPANPPDVVGVRETVCEYATVTNACGDGGAPALAGLNLISGDGLPGMAADANGIFICNQGENSRGRIRYANFSASTQSIGGIQVAPERIQTVGGTGEPRPFDNGLATGAFLASPGGIAVDPTNGNLWIADTLNSKIRYVNRTNADVKIFAGQSNERTINPGRITSARINTPGVDENGGSVIVDAGFDTPQGIFVTPQGIYIVDTKRGPGVQGPRDTPINRRTSLIRFVNTTSGDLTFFPGNAAPIIVKPGYIETLAGGTISDLSSNDNVDDGPEPFNAKFVGASDIVVAANGDMFIADGGNHRVRKIAASNGAVSSMNLPGNTSKVGNTTTTNFYTGLAIDPAGHLLVVESIGNTIYRSSVVATSLTATSSFSVLISGGLLVGPRDIVVDRGGTVAYVTNAGRPVVGDPASGGSGQIAGVHQIVKLTINGATATAEAFAGRSGQAGYSGDYGRPLDALLNLTAPSVNTATVPPPYLVPSLLCITQGLNGEILFTDTNNNAIRRIR